MFLYCIECDWGQDDYWAAGSYNPMEVLASWVEDLLERPLDDIIPGTKVTWREAIAQQFDKGARRIREMQYRTRAEFEEKNPDRICPGCGKRGTLAED